VTPCSVVGYHCFRGPCCFHLHLSTTLYGASTQKTFTWKVWLFIPLSYNALSTAVVCNIE